MSSTTIDQRRTAWVNRNIPDAGVRYVVTKTPDERSVFALQTGCFEVSRNYTEFADDLYIHFMETALKLAYMAGRLRMRHLVSDKIEDHRARLLEFGFKQGEIGLDELVDTDTIQMRAHLIRAMKAVVSIKNRSRNHLLTQLAKTIEAHLVEAMPELKDVQPYESPYLSTADFALEASAVM